MSFTRNPLRRRVARLEAQHARRWVERLDLSHLSDEELERMLGLYEAGLSETELDAALLGILQEAEARKGELLKASQGLPD